MFCPSVPPVDITLAADFYVHRLPGQPKDSQVKMHAGYKNFLFRRGIDIRHITVDEDHNGALFFWHFANKHIADRPRTVLSELTAALTGKVIWLNGGPGCSSEDVRNCVHMGAGLTVGCIDGDWTLPRKR